MKVAVGSSADQSGSVGVCSPSSRHQCATCSARRGRDSSSSGSRRRTPPGARRWLAVAVLATFLPLLPAEAQEPTALDAAQALEKTLTEAIARAEKSVVAIARYRKGRPPLPPPDGQPAPFRAGPAWRRGRHGAERIRHGRGDRSARLHPDQLPRAGRSGRERISDLGQSSALQRRRRAEGRTRDRRRPLDRFGGPQDRGRRSGADHLWRHQGPAQRPDS